MSKGTYESAEIPCTHMKQRPSRQATKQGAILAAPHTGCVVWRSLKLPVR